MSKNEKKLCPILLSSLLQRENFSMHFEAIYKPYGFCLKEECAWWVNDKCCIAEIPEQLHYIETGT